SSDISAIASAYPPTSRYRDSPISSGKPLKPDRPEICPGYGAGAIQMKMRVEHPAMVRDPLLQLTKIWCCKMPAHRSPTKVPVLIAPLHSHGYGENSF
ncbi:hypothetical protein, partial [Aquibium sp. ELW1220]|uniref:hypothetical protein n=1 Tax=Aquibium sp. ELW1220 TaxID=2976766 RepID=UPI0025B15205